MYAMYLCTPTCECACVRCTHVFPHVRVHMEVNGRCLPRLLSTLIFETWSLAEPGANQIGKNSWPVSSRDPPVSASPELELQVHGTVPRFYVGSRDLQLGHHACGASPLSTETSPHPSRVTFLQSLWPSFYYEKKLDQLLCQGLSRTTLIISVRFIYLFATFLLWIFATAWDHIGSNGVGFCCLPE